MSGQRRREFLTLGGALALAGAASAMADGAPLAPSVPKALPNAWSDAQRITLWPADPPGGGFAPQSLPPDWSPEFLRNVARPDLRVTRPNGQALLVVPGGSYQFVSVENEGLDVAQRMLAYGITVCVLTYRLPGEGWKNRSDVPLQDAQRAMRVIRSRASELGIDAKTVSVLGFSAGGHLAATLATQHSERTYEPVDPADALDPRPSAAGLIYPVVTMEKPVTHQQSRNSLLGDSPTTAEVVHRSAERHIDSATPPAFIVHACDDTAVPVENSLRFMNAMRDAGRPVEAHLLQEGGHAFGVGHPGSPSGYWIPLFSSWLRRVFSGGHESTSGS
jgi:acetyl esterase/lipase